MTCKVTPSLEENGTFGAKRADLHARNDLPAAAARQCREEAKLLDRKQAEAEEVRPAGREKRGDARRELPFERPPKDVVERAPQPERDPPRHGRGDQHADRAREHRAAAEPADPP